MEGVGSSAFDTVEEGTEHKSSVYGLHSSQEVLWSILWSMDERIVNSEDIREWHTNNKMLFSFLSLSTGGAAASFLRANFKPTELFPLTLQAFLSVVRNGVVCRYSSSPPGRGLPKMAGQVLNAHRNHAHTYTRVTLHATYIRACYAVFRTSLLHLIRRDYLFTATKHW